MVRTTPRATCRQYKTKKYNNFKPYYIPRHGSAEWQSFLHILVQKIRPKRALYNVTLSKSVNVYNASSDYSYYLYLVYTFCKFNFTVFRHKRVLIASPYMQFFYISPIENSKIFQKLSNNLNKWRFKLHEKITIRIIDLVF